MTDPLIPGFFIDVHIVQTLPLSGLNLDVDGNPKSAVIGGVTRARLSPQAVKRPVRLHIERRLPDHAAVRTRRLVHAVRDRLTEQGWKQDVAEYAALDVFKAASGGALKIGGSDEETGEDPEAKDPLATAALIYTPATTAGRLAEVAAKHRDAYEVAAADPQAAKKAQPKAPSRGRGKSKDASTATIADPETVQGLLASANGTIALLGRTLMKVDGGDRDAAVQVASAFTTHEASVEVDFFVAVDDYAAETEGIPDVAQMGDSQQTAGTFYRYATIGLTGLLNGIDNDVELARQLCDAFIDGFIHTVPKTGQTNSAAWTLPDLVYIAVRSDRPVNLSTAFDKPVRHRYQGNTEPSLAALSAYAQSIEKITAKRGLIVGVHAHTGTEDFAGLGDRADSYIDAIRTALNAAFGTTG